MRDYKFYYLPVAQKDKNGKVFYMPKPIIDVGINYKRGSPIIIKTLIDSGADHNFLPAFLGEILKIPIRKGRKQIITGIGGIRIESFYHDGIGIFIEGHKIKTDAHFSYNQQIPLLGQNGFFDKCSKIVFNRREEEIIVTV